MSMCKGPLGTLRGPWGTSGQHVTLGGGGPLVNMLHWGGDLWSTCYFGGGTSGQHVTLGGGGGGLCM